MLFAPEAKNTEVELTKFSLISLLVTIAVTTAIGSLNPESSGQLDPAVTDALGAGLLVAGGVTLLGIRERFVNFVGSLGEQDGSRTSSNQTILTT